MNEPTDIDALIAEARSRTYSPSAPSRLIDRLSDALETTAAELLHERERADKNAIRVGAFSIVLMEKEADLTRAREVIEQAYAKDLDTSPEPVKNGDDSLHVEQAHTPSDDEREALSNFLFSVYEHGSQPNALREADAILSFLAARRTAVPEPQGEPSGADRRALTEYINKALDGDCGCGVGEFLAGGILSFLHMRAALRAAGVVAEQGGEQR